MCTQLSCSINYQSWCLSTESVRFHENNLLLEFYREVDAKPFPAKNIIPTLKYSNTYLKAISSGRSDGLLPPRGQFHGALESV